ncbi:MAG: response regulator [Gammaproteobacteria bacterium]|jgi:two-component system response regulator BaeR|nr:two-component system response regulator BaeR [Chromatiales bacterium]MDP6674436.1 response regulator [Gammaproteobacteria bacterium]
MIRPEHTILIVEDEPKIARLLADYLEQAAFKTHCLDDGSTVVDWVRKHEPDLILLDLMLPGKDGLAICREVREFSQVPILMVTARVEEIDRLLGLELGADDYICKPFSPREVVARVKAVMRRIKRTPEETAAGYRGITIDADSFRVSVNNELLDLTPVEFRLLQTLSKYPGRVLTRNQLMDVVYTDGRVVSDRTMDSHIKNLRRKLAEVLPDAELIHSVYGIGYRLE